MRVTRVKTVIALLLALLMFVSTTTAESEWICQNCQQHNTGNFCVKCGQSKVTPTPIPTAKPTLAPTPEPEAWHCRHCNGDNFREYEYCSYCGAPKSGIKLDFVNFPLYKGMTEDEIKEALGGEIPTKTRFGKYELFFTIYYDEQGKLDYYTFSINNTYISIYAFTEMMQNAYGNSGWKEQGNMHGFTHFQIKETDGFTLRICYWDSFINILWVSPQLEWANVKMGREAVEAEKQLKTMRKVGNNVTFGHYPQTSSGKDKPIEWTVLDVQDNKVLLISRYGLDVMPYNEEKTDVTWEKCTLRKWLNESFLNKAFTTQEQACILMTNVDNSSGQSFWNTDGGSNTEDKVFLMSYAEANKYLGVTKDKNIKSRVAPTDYAIKAGASTKTEDGKVSCWWWLRSPGSRQDSASGVRPAGSLDYSNAYFESGCVRPAMWIDVGTTEASGYILADAEYLSDNNLETASPDEEKSVGNYVTFGHYPQTGDGDDNTPIEWIILEVKDNKGLLISRYGLDAKPYNTEYTSITWEKCTLRNWLNSDFYNKAFSTEEQSAILTTSVNNSKSQGFSYWSTSGGNSTVDKIFLLSYAEANKYDITYDDSNNMKSRVSPTVYAQNAGAFTDNDCKTEDGKAAGRFWLRSPGLFQNYAAVVNTSCSLGLGRVDDASVCVRPAMWVDLEAGSF